MVVDRHLRRGGGSARPTFVLVRGSKRLDVTDFERCVKMFAGRGCGGASRRQSSPQGRLGCTAAHRMWRVSTRSRRLRVSAASGGSCWLPVCRRSQGIHTPFSDDRGDPPRPANLYGATKAWAEALGGWVTATSHTSVVALRIGYFSEQPPAGGRRHAHQPVGPG